MPVTAYYGAQTQRAAAEVNRDLGLLNPRIADVIVVAAQEVIEGKHNDQFVVDPFQAGAGTSHHMNTNEVIANLAIELLSRVGQNLASVVYYLSVGCSNSCFG